MFSLLAEVEQGASAVSQKAPDLNDLIPACQNPLNPLVPPYPVHGIPHLGELPYFEPVKELKKEVVEEMQEVVEEVSKNLAAGMKEVVAVAAASGIENTEKKGNT